MTETGPSANTATSTHAHGARRGLPDRRREWTLTHKLCLHNDYQHDLKREPISNDLTL